MTLALLQLALLSMLLFGAGGSLLAAIAYPRVRCDIALREPAARARTTLVWIALPCLLAICMTALALQPSLAALVGHAVDDHCLTHVHDHAHLCLVHQPHGLGGLGGWVLLGVVCAWLARVVLGAAISVRAAHRTVAPLIEHATPDARLGIAWVRCAAPVALTVGLVRPRVFLSDTLREVLPATSLDALIAHERAHQRRRDVVKRAVASILVRFHVPWLREVLLEDLVLSTELVADAEAAEAVGSTLHVADAILAMERLAASIPRTHVSFGFGEANVGSRIEALLAEPCRPARPVFLPWIAAAVGLLVVLAAPVHDAAETIVTLVAR